MGNLLYGTSKSISIEEKNSPNHKISNDASFVVLLITISETAMIDILRHGIGRLPIQMTRGYQSM